MAGFDHSLLTSGLENEKKSGNNLKTFYSYYKLTWLMKVFFTKDWEIV